MYRILFVCVGNICRSPTAEGFFRHHLAKSALLDRIETDSAGTHGYHVGHAPDSRALKAASRHGVDLSSLCARQVSEEDFRRFDLILAMDDFNFETLSRLRDGAGSGGADLRRMMEYSTRFHGVREVPDPYYGEERDFARMCELLDDATRGLLASLEESLAET